MRIARSAIFLAAALVACAQLVACAHLPHPVEQPTATVRSAQVSPQLGGLLGRVTFDVFNPNPIGLPVDRVDWQLWIGDFSAATGSVELAQTIPARASAPVETKLFVAALDAAGAVMRIGQGERRYRIRGTLRFSTSLGHVSVPFQVDGVLGG